jgi:DNA-binding LytR/AlgR family response regulator
VKLKIGICDDDLFAIETIVKYIYDHNLHNDEFEFDLCTYHSGEDLLSKYTTANDLDVLFLDAKLPGIDGISTAESIRNIPGDRVKIIIISSCPEYMESSFSIHPYNYLSKPLEYDALNRVFNELLESILNSHTTRIILDNKGDKEIINISEVLYIETVKTSKDMLVFKFDDKEIYTKGFINAWAKDLKKYLFVTPHRGYLVNLRHINLLSKNFLTLDNGGKIPLSRKHEKEVRSMFNKRIINIDL